MAQTLVDEATRLFARRGYSVTTIDDVVAAANLTKGAFYYHFRAKDDLLYEIYNVVISAEIDGMMQILQQGLSPLEALVAVIEDVSRVTATHPDNVIVYTREMHLLTPEKSRALRENRRRYHGAFRDLLTRAKADGTIDSSVNEEMATIGFFGLLHQFYFWYGSGRRPFDDDQFVAEATAWFLRGIGARAEAQRRDAG